ncbi:SWIM zinc finger family protein [Bacteroides sp. 519]|uniref:SWIM zinc finger family protein n=1 Tax=Bacteroides sp. 519 TaxID=2302937 RepID=UPI0013D25D97|nr:SWIM zinc finger family protein [Bacteroides sp. 519]NDV57121.1 hypothetical protein [Bacteroides sp. 519]
MDWKDNIIANTDCHAQASQYTPFASESFLVTLANKGLYKRALKDIETVTKIEINPNGDKLEVIWDDATVTLQPNVAESTCNCPSKTVCKHILMGIIAVDAYAKSVESGEPGVESGELRVESYSDQNSQLSTLNSQLNDWKDLKEVDIAALRKQAGKKIFEDSLRLVQDGWSADFVEHDMLEATLNTESITVYFPKQDSVKHAVCKCGEKGLCKHKLIAILSYLSSRGELKADNDENNFSLVTDETVVLLKEADNFVIRLLDKGLITSGETDVESAIQYSIRMETNGIGNLARMFRSLSVDIENMMNKHVGFDHLTTFDTLTRLHNTMRLIIENSKDSKLISQLIEGTRSDYYTTPVGTFSGLGVSPWQTRSGYFGLTAYVYYHEKKSICTFTISMADFYEQTEKLADMDNIERLYYQNTHWANGISLSAISQSTFTLRNFKLNRQNRLSSSSQTQCDITGQVNREYYQNLPAAQLFELESDTEQAWTYFSKKTPPKLVLIPFSFLRDVSFNHTEQKLHFTMENGDDETSGEIEYNQFSKPAIKYLELKGHATAPKNRFMVCLRRKSTFIPISVIDDSGVDNFYINS